MKKTILTMFLGAASLLLPQNSSAALLVGVYKGTGNPSAADITAPGFSGTITAPATLTGWNSTDGTFGPGIPDLVDPEYPLPGENSDGWGGAVAANITMQVFNNSSTSYSLTGLYFDITIDGAYPSQYTVSYKKGANPYTDLAGPTSITGNTQANNGLNWDDVLIPLSTITLAAGESIWFNFFVSNGGGLDNVALTGIPETGSTLALMGLLGSGAAFRSRRKKVA